MKKRIHNLTPAEIVSAFPEGAGISRRLQLQALARKKDIEKHLASVYNNPQYDEGTKAVIEAAIRVFYLDPAVSKYNFYSRYVQMYKKNPHKNGLNKEKAKTVLLQDLFTLIKARYSSKRITCKCPLHDEKTPSFVIYTETNTFYCYGCHAHGDVIAFVMKFYNKDFKEAVSFLENFK